MHRAPRSWLLAVLLLQAGVVGAVGVGEVAPDFDVPSLRGDGRVSLAQYRGKVVLLDFWASWCGPCAASVPHYRELRSGLAGRGFELVALGLDENAADGRAFLDRFAVGYPAGSDPQGTVASRYALKGMPYAVLIDRDGIVRVTHTGFEPADFERLRARIEQLLQEGDG